MKASTERVPSCVEIQCQGSEPLELNASIFLLFNFIKFKRSGEKPISVVEGKMEMLVVVEVTITHISYYFIYAFN